MNEQIQKLAIEAKLSPALLLRHWGNVDALTDSERKGLEQLEKFAELIVRKCAGLLEKEAESNHDEGTETFNLLLKEANWMKQHFGVE